jgi:hypothetical protein
VVTWAEFANAEPDLAAFARERMEGRIMYQATLRLDGGPRVHPVSRPAAVRLVPRHESGSRSRSAPDNRLRTEPSRVTCRYGYAIRDPMRNAERRTDMSVASGIGMGSRFDSPRRPASLARPTASTD